MNAQAAQDATIALGSGRAGPVRKHFAGVVAACRGFGPFSPEEELYAALGLLHADAVDRAAARGEARAVAAASSSLLAMMVKLERRGEVPGDSAAGRDAGAELRLVMDGPPQVGDAAHA